MKDQNLSNEAKTPLANDSSGKDSIVVAADSSQRGPRTIQWTGDNIMQNLAAELDDLEIAQPGLIVRDEQNL